MIRFLIVALYLLIGFLMAFGLTVWTEMDKIVNTWSMALVAIVWPVWIASFIFFGLSRLLLYFASKTFFIILFLILLIMLLIKCTPAEAATIHGDTPLAGISVLFAEKAKKGITWYDPDDLELLAQVIEHENYCNGERAMYLTGAVVINRRNSPKWPNTIQDVIYQKGQYSTTGKFWSRPVHQDCYRIASWLLIFGCDDVPANVVFQAMFKQGSGIYEKINTDYFCFE